jgi:predicted lipid-binding transport protein (Tim44 family)
MADVAALPGVNATGAAGRASALANALSLAEQRDRSFRAASFLEGASRAYEDISIAFAAGDRELLRNLVSPEVFDDFDAVIEDRERRGERTQATFVQIAPPLIVGAELRDGQTQISIRFAGELLTAMPAPDSELYRSNTVLDVWTFAKPTASHDPAWRLIATNLPDVGTGIHRQPWTVQ